LGKIGRARLLPSYLLIKLGRSLALPMKLQAIPRRKLYDLRASGISRGEANLYFRAN